MKSIIYRLAALGLAAALMVLFPGNALAQAEATGPKEEVVYVRLGPDGSFGSAYVVNAFTLDEPGALVDYGSYDSVENLTTDDELILSDGVVQAQLPAGRFYYQGNLNQTELPWIVTLSYTLDGQSVSAQELAGARGAVEIRLSIRSNPDGPALFADHFAVQTTVTLDTGYASDITAQGATVANAGRNKVISFIKMPGSDGDYTITFNATDLRMDGIQISGIPLSLDVTLPDTGELTGSLTELQSGIADLDDGVQDLDGGAADLANGALQLSQGIADMKDGLGQLRSGFYQLVSGNSALMNGSQQILDGLDTLSAQLDGLTVSTGDLTALAQGSAAIAQGLGSLSGGLDALKGSFAQADTAVGAAGYSSLSQANAATISQLNLQITALQADSVANAAQIQQLTWIVSLLTVNNGLLGGLRTGINGDGTAANPGLAAGAAALTAQYASFDAVIQALPATLGQMAEGLDALQAGVDELAGSYDTFNTGLGSYLEGTSDLYAGCDQLFTGMAALVQGGQTLAEGAGALSGGTDDLAQGTGELRSQTQDMDQQVQENINTLLEDYTGGDYTLVSFVSPLNTSVASVQFVMATQSIDPADTEPAAEEQTGDTTFWQRLLALFGLDE